MNAVYAWNKISISYAFSMWEGNINFFPNYDYLVYNSSVMQLNWFENSLEIFGHSENIYLNSSLYGRGKTKWYEKGNITK
jgi:hypothetical protein